MVRLRPNGRRTIRPGRDAHRGRNVDSVFVAGRAVKRDGRMLNVDVEALARKLYANRDRLFAESAQPTKRAATGLSAYLARA